MLIDVLLECETTFPDHLQVVVDGAPPLLVEPEEVGLTAAGGARSGVSEVRGVLDAHGGIPDGAGPGELPYLRRFGGSPLLRLSVRRSPSGSGWWHSNKP